MDTIKLTLELTPAQLTRLMLDLRTGADVPEPKSSEQELTEEIRNSYHPGEPRSASNAWLEDKLAEAEAIIAQRDSQLAAMDKLLQEIQGERDDRLRRYEVEVDRLKRQINQQASNMDCYKLELRHAEQELEHLRNYVGDVVEVVEEKHMTAVADQADREEVPPGINARILAELHHIGEHLTKLLKEAKRE